jgi:hypothetical protein
MEISKSQYDVAKQLVVDYETQEQLKNIVYDKFLNSSTKAFAKSIYFSWIANGVNDFDNAEFKAAMYIKDIAKDVNEIISLETAKELFYSHCK